MARAHESDDGIISGINVTPLVDITLVLLIIFIVTAKIMVTPAIPVDLPRATQGREVQVIFSTVLTAAGGTFVNGVPVADDRILIERAHEAHAADPDLRAIIQADGDVPHRRVMAVLDALKQAGVTAIAFGAVPAATPALTPINVK